MVNNKTVIVLGAGASKEFGLPIGSELMNNISSILYRRKGYAEVADQLTRESLIVYSRKNGPSINELMSASTIITNALPLAISIDNLIDTHRGNKVIEVCSKIAIVRSILSAERNSNLFFKKDAVDEKLNFEFSKETWLNLLFKIITENATLDDLKDRLSNFVFIVFNYDRCLEHFFYYAFQSLYSANSNQARELVASLNLYHVFGKVGDLPWIDYDNSIDFGEEINAYKLVSLIDEIKTFTENKNDDWEEVKAMRDHIRTAKNVLFLGFAYHKLNLGLLALDGDEHKDKNTTQYYGTAYQISDSNTEKIIAELSKIGGLSREQMYIHNELTCYELLSEYWRTFSLTNL